jgi:hypothetical protein
MSDPDAAYWYYDYIEPPPPERPEPLDPPGKWDPVACHPLLRERVARVHARHPSWVNSCWRSAQDQQLFWNCAQAKKQTGRCPPGCERSACASANPPGKSNHEAEPFGPSRALAIDWEPQDGDVPRWRQVCYEEGLHDPIGNEWWHWQPNEVRSGQWRGFPPGW